MKTISHTSQLPLRKILLATDFSPASEQAAQVAFDLCQAWKADLCILHVFEYSAIAPPECGGELLELDSFYQDAERSLDTLVQQARRRGISCEGKLESGISHNTILENAATEKIDLIVLGTRPIHGFERLVFGSTAEAVLRKATCPVFTVGPRAAHIVPELDPPGGVVIFATDFHLATTEALQLAEAFSKHMKLPLHCLHVLPMSLEEGPHRNVIPLIITEALQHLAAGIADKLNPLTCAVTYGSEISNAMVEYARKHKARLIVLGVRTASLAASHIPAHIAYRVIAEAPCPVLTMAYRSQPFATATSTAQNFRPSTLHNRPSSANT